MQLHSFVRTKKKEGGSREGIRQRLQRLVCNNNKMRKKLYLPKLASERETTRSVTDRRELMHLAQQLSATNHLSVSE